MFNIIRTHIGWRGRSAWVREVDCGGRTAPSRGRSRDRQCRTRFRQSGHGYRDGPQVVGLPAGAAATAAEIRDSEFAKRWTRQQIDWFVLARLEQKKLQP